MGKESEIRARKKEIVLDTLKWLQEEREKKYSIFMKNSHGVYRDEIAQWKAEIEMRLIEEIVNKINEFREKAYVPVDRGVGVKVGGEREEEEETQTGLNSGGIDST
jgi:hypothetical protein